MIRLLAILALGLFIISCEKANYSPNTPEKIILFFDDFDDSKNWEITNPPDSIDNNISISNGAMIASVLSTKPAILISMANAQIVDSLLRDSTITKFGIRIKLRDGDIHYHFNWPPYGSNGIKFTIDYGYYQIVIPNYIIGQNVILPYGKEYIAEYDNGLIKFFVDGVEFNNKYVYLEKDKYLYSGRSNLQVWMDGFFINNPSYNHKVEIDFIEFYVYK